MKQKKKRKLLHIKNAAILQCDNPKCDFVLNEIPKDFAMEELINAACPNCAENLLTFNDYIRHKKVLAFVDWVNKYFGWLGSVEVNPESQSTIVVSTHDKISFTVQRK